MGARSLLKEAERILRAAVNELGYGDEVFEALRTPERVVQVKIPVRSPEGAVKYYVGWRSQHNSALGPYKGGVRFHPQVTMDEVIALSMMMTWKNALMELPYGGAKGGVRVNPKELSRHELEQLSRGYVRALAQCIGPDIDIPAPDVYTDQQIMAWMLDEWERTTGIKHPGAFTGKPPILGGLTLREAATGIGVAIVAAEVARKLLGGVEGKTVAVQGFGSVGYWAAKTLHDVGAKVVAVSDSRGGIVSTKGLNPEDVRETKLKSGSVVYYERAEKRITNEELLELDVDILIPAAVENVITEENAGRIKAKLVVEGANGPTTAEADRILAERGVVVVPDVLASAGGVVCSHIEWVNNRMGGWITDEEARAKLEAKMRSATHAVLELWEKEFAPYKKPMRLAAYALAVERVVRAMKLRGLL